MRHVTQVQLQQRVVHVRHTCLIHLQVNIQSCETQDVDECKVHVYFNDVLEEVGQVFVMVDKHVNKVFSRRLLNSSCGICKREKYMST